MRYSLYNTIVLWLITALLLSGCGSFTMPINNDLTHVLADGEVSSVQPRTSIYIVQQALKEAQFTRILTDKKDNYVFFNPFKDMDGISWVGYNLKNKGLIEMAHTLQSRMGNTANYKTGREFYDYLFSTGWKAVKPENVPLWFTTAVAVAESSTITIMNSMPTFCIMFAPMSIIPTPEVFIQ